jgi:opacity protein-like surface antigen
MAKLTYPLILIALFPMVTGWVANAQNSDLGLLLGGIAPTNEVSTGGTGVRIQSSDGVAGQVNYAYQLKGWPACDLYMEIPFFLAARTNSVVQGRGSTSSGTDNIGAVVPGVRLKVRLAGRASVYAAAGAGIGWFGQQAVVTSPGNVLITDQTTATAAFDLGGGLDFRLTKLLSLRGEVRDVVTSTGSLSDSGRHNNPIYTFGFAFHF